MSDIVGVKARQVLDSRGNPTVEVDVILSDGVVGRSSVPSGASTGAGEALELRDADASRYCGRGVLRALENIDKEISPAVVGRSVLDQSVLDATLIDLDGTSNKRRLGGNAIVGVSVAIARAAALSEGVPLYRYFRRDGTYSLPVPMFNILNGGKHADDSTDVQEFMVVPAGVPPFGEAVRAGV